MGNDQMTRRRFGAAIGSAFGALAFGDACVVATRDTADQARLTARPIPLLAPVTTATLPLSHPMGGNNNPTAAVPVFRRETS